jgi:hypothetical protein
VVPASTAITTATAGDRSQKTANSSPTGPGLRLETGGHASTSDDHFPARRNTMYIGIGTLVLIILLILLLT